VSGRVFGRSGDRAEKGFELNDEKKLFKPFYRLNYFGGFWDVTVTTDDAFDASQFEVKFDENEQPILNFEITNVIDDVVSSHVNNKLEFIGQNMHDIFDDALAELKYILV